MNTTQRLGFLSALGLALVGVVYVVVVGFGIADAGLDDPIVDPILSLMEALTLISAPLIVMLMAAIYHSASEHRKVFGAIALSFGAIMAALTSTVHFIALTAGRQTDFTTLAWPSTLYAAELLAWDVFLGLSLLFSAPVFAGSGRFALVRRALAVTGALCLIGAVGPMVGDMALQRIGVLGYGIGLPICSVILVLFFYRRGSV